MQQVADFAATHHDADVPISAKIESELIDLPEAEAKDFLSVAGVDESGVGALSAAPTTCSACDLFHRRRKGSPRLDDQRRATAPQAAGVIHTDFEKGFIKAETISYDDYVKYGSVPAARRMPAWCARRAGSTWSRTGT